MTESQPPEPEREPQHVELTAARVLREVRRRGVTTSAKIATALTLSNNRVNQLLKALREEGLVETDGSATRRFAKAPSITLQREAALLVGVDLTLDRATVAVSNLGFDLFNDPATASVPVPIDDCDATLESIAKLIRREVESAKDHAPLMGVGVGLPGPVQRGIGSPESDHLLPAWKGHPVADELSRHLEAQGLPRTRVEVVNDASLGALGVIARATWGDPINRPADLIYVRVTHGVGMGLVMKGHLVTGANGFAGEIGHVRVDAEGPVCVRCRRRGCLESVASERAVLDVLNRHRWEAGATERAAWTIDEVKATGDARAKEEVKRAGWYIGFALAAAANVLNPAWIVLGGGLTAIPEFPEAVEKTLNDYALDQSSDALDVVTWDTLFNDKFPGGDIDIGQGLSPELLGALAIVVDEFADDFLRDAAYAAGRRLSARTG